MSISRDNTVSQKGGIWLPVLAILILAAGAYYYFSVYQKEEPPVADNSSLLPASPPTAQPQETPEPAPEVEEPAQAEIEVTAEEPSDEVVVQEEPTDTTVLALTDETATDLATDLVGEDPVRNYLISEGLLSKLVAMIDSLSGDQVPGNIIPIHGPGGEVQATSNGVTEEVNPETGLPQPLFLMDPVNFQRYTPFVEVLEAIDIDELMQNYQLYYPQLQQEYIQLGYAQGSFEERLLEVISELLATPEPEQPLTLVKPEAFYEFVNPEYEALTAGQKILLRSGPSNAARIKEVLRNLETAIQTQRE